MFNTSLTSEGIPPHTTTCYTFLTATPGDLQCWWCRLLLHSNRNYSVTRTLTNLINLELNLQLTDLYCCYSLTITWELYGRRHLLSRHSPSAACPAPSSLSISQCTTFPGTDWLNLRPSSVVLYVVELMIDVPT